MSNNLLRDSLNDLNIDFGEDMIKKFNDYYDLLIEWNKKINLTAITDYEEVVVKHFIDSILICRFIDISNKRIFDIGTGGGFPGIPLKILCPDCEMILIDSLNKRIGFLNEVINSLGINKIEAIHGRAEDLARDKDLRNSGDIVVSRAVSNLSTLSEYCIPFIKKGGIFISYKSEKSDDEIESAANAISILNSRIKEVKEIAIPFSDIRRKFVIIENIKEVDKRYPRKAGIPIKNPL